MPRRFAHPVAETAKAMRAVASDEKLRGFILTTESKTKARLRAIISAGRNGQTEANRAYARGGVGEGACECG